MVQDSSSPAPSWATIFHSPPPVKTPYDPSEALGDVPGARYALHLFLSSHMLESEEYCHKSDESKERLYFTTGYGLIQCVKGLMSYADEDLISGINHTRHGNYIAGQHRKKVGFFGSILGGSSTAFIRSMTPVERHAELVYAESLFEKALLGIVYSGDWLAFIKEALNMRTTIGIYRQLGAFIEEADAAYTATLPSADADKEDPSIDVHFRSGVYLGLGLFNIILSLMPGKLAALGELFGYHGDRQLGLEMLMRAGGWGTGAEPVSTADEGVRRSVSDMVLLIFHLVLSSFTVEGVDIGVAGRILEWNLKRYPNGVFFLFGAGRLALHHAQPRTAIHYYTRAMNSQMQYRNLDHISFWEVAVARLALWQVGDEVPGDSSEEKEEREQQKEEKGVGGSAACWRVLEQEATWSKAIYSYGLAACLLEDWDTDEDTPEGRIKKAARMKEAAALMARVPGLRQKIAGKSIPLEKFVARKARKFTSQKGRLLLPALEVAYLFQAIAHAPRGVVEQRMLPLVRTALGRLGQFGEGVGAGAGGASASSSEGSLASSVSGKKKPNGKANGKANGVGKRQSVEKYEGGVAEYWDDLCLARFLEGVCLRYLAYPDPDAILETEEHLSITAEEAARGAEAAFRAVFEHGPKIELDHHLVYHAHFELGRLLACQGRHEEAKTEFDLIISGTCAGSVVSSLSADRVDVAGKYLEVGPSGRKGKYSMENALHMRTHAALDMLPSASKA
ncbi:hypothetical protein H0H81_000907 [Sphagnurus paluster]|uniref:Tetratricopeptide repeat protein 39B n=1 Tax=Sphagnurus paluster TaxID=117069 RepID=A0A9P7FTA5_9AGAR|nr:hypothetical protein H0H81_000907 [Sphagnurus paluster]